MFSSWIHFIYTYQMTIRVKKIEEEFRVKPILCRAKLFISSNFSNGWGHPLDNGVQDKWNDQMLSTIVDTLERHFHITKGNYCSSLIYVDLFCTELFNEKWVFDNFFLIAVEIFYTTNNRLNAKKMTSENFKAYAA